MPTKLRPIEDVIANPAPEPRDKNRPTGQDKIEPKPPAQPPPSEKRS
jgi:hypothetical protein